MTWADELAVRNLVALLNRDGGHHQDEVGMEQAAKDAEARVIRMMNALAERNIEIP
jgi:hypothetical protein